MEDYRLAYYQRKTHLAFLTTFNAVFLGALAVAGAFSFAGVATATFGARGLRGFLAGSAVAARSRGSRSNATATGSTLVSTTG